MNYGLRMPYAKRPPRYPWRDYLTEEESVRVDRLRSMKRLNAAQKYELVLIRNRALQRARYAEKKR